MGQVPMGQPLVGRLLVDDLADVRAGDKGDTLILAVLPRDPAGYAVLERALTAQAVARHFGRPDDVTRTVLPHLPALVFRLPGILGGGVTGYLGLDGHGKTLGYHLLMLPVES
ncbi:AtuA-related protein [Promicromonospora soli]